MVEWNDGLSVGVKVLDDDHKKLLEIINRLSASIDSEVTKDVLEGIFQDLEDYTLIHFKREESFFYKCNYKEADEHKKQHTNFADKIPELKSKLLSANNYYNAQEVSIFLTDWLINHIISEDIPLINYFDKCGLIPHIKTNTSWLEKLIIKTTNSLNYSKRMLLSAIIPLFGMLFLGYVILYNDYIKHEYIKNTVSLTHILTNINEIVHNTQIERGLSTGFIASKTDKFKTDLKIQQTIVDKEIDSFKAQLRTVNDNELSLIQAELKTLQKDLAKIHKVRQKVYEKSISEIDAISFYTNMIKNILSITSKIAFTNIDKKIISSISTLSSLLHIKEIIGQQRAYGTMIIEKKNREVSEYIKYIELLGARATLIDTFQQTATKSQQERYLALLDSTIVKQITTYEEHIKDNNLRELNSELWFKLMTKYINEIKLFEEKLLYETDELINEQSRSAINNLILWIIFFTIILSGTIFIIYIFEKSSKKQIANFTDAMKHIAHGGRSLRLDKITTKDEIADMYNSYETTRQKLLKADIFTQLYLSQKAIELKNQQKETIALEKIAFIDPLTGALNRRKFEELSILELKRSTRYKHDLSLLLLDIDHFKNVNDSYGHAVGDEVLQFFSSICINMTRDLDLFARIGGEEFVIMMPETDKNGAYIFAERLRNKVFNSSITIENQKIRFSVSIGISLLDKNVDSDIKSILQRADNALYKAKREGRNRTAVYENPNKV